LLVDAGETGSSLVCNTSEQDAYGIGLGPDSNGNVVRGNFISKAADGGIVIYGYRWNGTVWGIPYGNVVKKNLVQASGRADLAAVVFDLDDGDFVVPDDVQCQNSWKHNQYSTSMGPENGVAPPEYLKALARRNVTRL